MPKGTSVPCELCSSNIVVGLVYEFEPDIFICDECRDKLVKIEGFWFDGHAAQHSVHPTLLTEPVNYCNPVNGVHAPFCTGHKSQSG